MTGNKVVTLTRENLIKFIRRLPYTWELEKKRRTLSSRSEKVWNEPKARYQLLYILTSEHMLAHAFAWTKMMKNA